MEEIIKKYLEELSQKDECFKDKYIPGKFEDCIKYIFDLAQDSAQGKNAVAIEHETVFKWARDFYIEGTAQKQLEIEQKKAAEELERMKKKEAEEKARLEKERFEREHALGQTTIFDIIGG